MICYNGAKTLDMRRFVGLKHAEKNVKNYKKKQKKSTIFHIFT